MCPTPERLVDLVEGRLDPDEQRAIEEHIDTCEPCRAGLSASVRGDVPSTWTLGRYRIDDVIGQGGMGIVYRGWDPSLAREVAIKVVKSEDADLRARLAREAQSLARLNHVNVCQVYDVGIDDTELWIAMELVRGTTLRAWVAAKPDVDEVLDVLVGAGRGLAAAHAVGLVHRDVKPENILVDRERRAIVSDFGLARDIGDSATRSSVLAGTLAYMAPEQIEGTPADARSDQYAFAVTAHEVLTGARPRPRNRANPALPARLRTALDRALSDDPAARFPSIDELVAAFVAPARRRRWPAIAAALVAVVAISAGGFIAVRGLSSRAVASNEPAPAAPEPQQATPAPPIVKSVMTEPAKSTPEAPPPTPVAESVAKPARPKPAAAPVEKQLAPAPPIEKRPTGSLDIGTQVQVIQKAVVAGDGKSCMAAFAEIDGMKPPEALVKPMAQLRGQCLMLAGQCDAGKRVDRANWEAYNLSEENVERSVDLDVSIFCRSGTRSERDRMLRAMYVLGDSNYKHTLAECRDAFAEAKLLVDKVPGGGPMDMLNDAKDRIGAYAPACFARTGDCSTAWRVAKELDTRRPSTDYTKRSSFVNAVGLLCADKDQGTLTDAEIVWRAIVELDNVRMGKARTAAFCTSRIEQATTALARAGGSDPELRRAPDQLAEHGADCLAATADCKTAFEQFAALDGGRTDDARLRKRFKSAVHACQSDE